MIKMKKNIENIVVGLIEYIAVGLIVLVIAFTVFFDLNRISGSFVAEYDVEVQDVYGRDGGRAYFTTPDGREGDVPLNDYRIIIPDDADMVEPGDTIRVKEYIGIFGSPYYDFVEEIKDKGEN